MAELQEEGISFDSGREFYNPYMHLCRSFSSLVVGALPSVRVLDAFSASGIRGLRYAKENPNVCSLEMLDISPGAVSLCRKNAEKNGIGAKAHEGEFNKFIIGKDGEYDLLEIDPFGSPAPYLYNAIRFLRFQKRGFLSVTATDTAVLCGAHANACMRIYHSVPLHEEICHETGVRILWKFISQIAGEFEFGIVPLATLSHRHFFKIFLRLEKGAGKGVDCFRKTGYIVFCPHCRHREGREVASQACPKCGKKAKWAGPLWLGELHDAETLGKMLLLNSRRDYAHREKLEGEMRLMEGEVGMPPYFFNIHSSCGKLGIQPPPRTETLLERLRNAGFRAARTHFSPIGVKTDADARSFAEALRQ
ncbi:MAG: tRNA (guanine(10)-N(2))-dimethyltransferase [Candidatus Bilamarchaeaceae archaeon]